MQMSIASIIQAIKSKLSRELHTTLQNDWISECIQFFVDRECTADIDSLYESAKEQFLLSSLSDSANRLISDMFFSKKKDLEWKMNDTILLQMQYIIEVSEPFYEQWRRLHDIKLDDLNPETRESKTFHTKKKRMFKLELTDGHKTIHAMEMKPIKCLNSKLKPGTKVLISGPAKVVNAIIFLEPQNIKIVGGEVDDLLIVNAYENILLKQLKKPTVDTPVKDYAEPVYEEETSTRSNFQALPPAREEPRPAVKAPIAPPPPPPDDPFDDDDDDIDFELLAQIEAEANRKYLAEQQQKQQQQQQANANNFFMEEVDEEEERRILDQIDLTAPPPPLPQAPANVQKAADLLIPNLLNLPDLSEDMEVDEVEPVKAPSPVRKATFTDDDYAYRIEDKYNYVTIDQYVGLSKRERMQRQYALEARVHKVIKLRIEHEAWVFLAMLTDAYSKNVLQVRFSDEVVAGFAKRTAREMIAMRERVVIQPQLKDDMTKALRLVNECTEHTTLLVSVTMKVQLPADYENVIQDIIPKTDDVKHLMILKIADEEITLA